HHAVHMEERHDAHQAVVGRELQPFGDLPGVGEQVAVSQQAALWFSCCAGSVDDDGFIIFGDRPQLDYRSQPGRTGTYGAWVMDRSLHSLINQDDIFEQWQTCARFLEVVEKSPFGDERDGFGVAEDVFDLFALE